MLANKKQIAQSLTRQHVEATQTTTLPGVLERGATVVHFALIRHTTHISMPRKEINGTIIIGRHHACMHEQVSRQANAAALDSRNTLDQNDHIQTKEAIRKIFLHHPTTADLRNSWRRFRKINGTGERSEQARLMFSTTTPTCCRRHHTQSCTSGYNQATIACRQSK